MTTFTCSLAQGNHIKGLINDWLKTRLVTDFSLYDIVVNSPKLEDFEFTRWGYTFEKPDYAVLVKLEIPIPVPKVRSRVSHLNNLGGI